MSPSISNLKGTLFDNGLEVLIDYLINQYPEFVVALRPRPEDRSHPIVKSIARRLSDNHRFILGLADDYTESYAKGIVLITDKSSQEDVSRFISFLGEESKSEYREALMRLLLTRSQFRYAIMHA